MARLRFLPQRPGVPRYRAGGSGGLCEETTVEARDGWGSGRRVPSNRTLHSHRNLNVWMTHPPTYGTVLGLK